MSSARLLVLGVVRIMQPVHGYDVRRELLSWRLDGWMNVQSGSIYSALKTLEKDGLIEVTGQTRSGGRPERTEYVITAEGNKEFAGLLRTAWWQLQRPTEPLMPALCLMLFMPRAELIAALESRISQLAAQSGELHFTRAGIRDGATGKDGEIPEHVREILDFGMARLRSEVEWATTLLERLRAGAYVFFDEHPDHEHWQT